MRIDIKRHIMLIAAAMAIAVGGMAGRAAIRSVSYQAAAAQEPAAIGEPLIVLMYHNIVSDSGRESKYQVRVSTLERDMCWLRDNGYTVLGIDGLYALQKGEIAGGKYCMLTFDDGFIGYIRYLPALLEKYDMRAVVSIVGEFTVNGSGGYLNKSEVAELAASGRVDIACHSFCYHHITAKMRGVKKADGEDISAYKERLSEDDRHYHSLMDSIGIKTKVYAYPYGEHSAESERVVDELGYNVTFTCAEKYNYITRNPRSLRLLGRVNRSGMYSDVQKAIDKAKK